MNFKHGHSRAAGWSREYHTWRGILDRCYLPTMPSYHRYGGRGIRVCRRWHTFENFLKDMGRKPAGLSIDRIDNNKSYSFGNCRWADRRMQAINRKQHKLTRAKVRQIKALLETARWGDKQGIARKFSVSPQLISDILAKRAWAHVV